MGTFGTAIFSDDLACDIRDEYKELIGEGISSEQATEELLTSYSDSLNDSEEASIFWLSLAAVQWKKGRLIDSVKDKAISIIEGGDDLGRWALESDAKLVKKREKKLLELKEQLLSPQPVAKKIGKVYKEFTPFEVGDVFSYAHSTGNFVLFRVIGHFEDNGGRRPICEILNYLEKQIIKDPLELAELPYIRSTRTDSLESPISKFFLGDIKPKYEPKDKVELVAKNIPVMQDASSPTTLIFWRALDKTLTVLFSANQSSN